MSRARRVPASAAGISCSLVVALVAATGMLTLPGRAPEVRAAAPDLTIVTDATYEVQPEQHRVQVTVDMVLTNHLRDTRTRRYYFDHAFIARPSRRVRLQADVVGPRQARGRRLEEDGQVHRPGPHARDRIYSGKTAKYRLTLLARRPGRHGDP